MVCRYQSRLFAGITIRAYFPTFEEVSDECREGPIPQGQYPSKKIGDSNICVGEGAKVSMVEKGFPSLETRESLLANFSLNSPALDLPRIYETLFARPLPMNAMDQQKVLEALKVGLGDKSRALYQRHYQTTQFRVYRQDRLCLVDGGPQHTGLRGEEGKPERANRHKTCIHACFKEAGRHPGITHC